MKKTDHGNRHFRVRFFFFFDDHNFDRGMDGFGEVTLAREADDSWILEQCAVLPPMKEPFEPETWWKFRGISHPEMRVNRRFIQGGTPKKPVKKVGWNNSTYPRQNPFIGVK